MSDDEDKPAPDFAMLRAVEILAKLVENHRRAPQVAPVPLDRPVVLFNEQCSFELGKTTPKMVEKAFGIGFPFPYKGWATYGIAGAERTRYFLSLMYKNDVLSAAEFYIPRSEAGGPGLAPRLLGEFRLIPGEVRLSMAVTSLGEQYTSFDAGPQLVYDASYQAVFPGGIAMVMGNKGIITRLALYAAS